MKRPLSTAGYLLAVVSLLAVAACAPTAGPAAPAAPAAPPPAAPAAQQAAPAAQQPAAPAQQAAPAAAQPPPIEKISVRFGWVWKGEFAYYVVAKETGIFQRHGFDVEFGEGRGTPTALNPIANKQDTFAYSGNVGYLLLRSRGMPVKMVALLSQESPQVLISYPDNPVRVPKDMEGKSLLFSAGDSFQPLWPAFAAGYGIDRSKVREQNTSPDARNQLFLGRQVDVMPEYYTATLYPLEERLGFDLVKMPLGEWDSTFAGIVANEDTLRERPDMVRRYVAAVLEAFEYTGQHLDEATELMVPLLGGQSAPVVRKQIEATIGLAHTKNTEGKPLGWSDPRDWQNWLDLQVKGGELKPEEMRAPDYYFTNEFLPAR